MNRTASLDHDGQERRQQWEIPADRIAHVGLILHDNTSAADVRRNNPTSYADPNETDARPPWYDRTIGGEGEPNMSRGAGRDDHLPRVSL